MRALSESNAANESNAADVIKERLFSGGPTDFTDRLSEIDERMQSLIRRNGETEAGRKCVSEGTIEWNPDQLPGDASFPMRFSCSEDMGALQLYFGQDAESGTSYVAEIQQGDGDSFNGAGACRPRFMHQLSMLCYASCPMRNDSSSFACSFRSPGPSECRGNIGPHLGYWCWRWGLE